MADYYVYSTASCDNYYCVYEKTDVQAASHIIKAKVLIRGGANVSNENLITPKGVMTRVTQAQMDILEASEGFKRHRLAGFIKVEKTAKNPDKVAEEMTPKDGSAPITPNDKHILQGAKPVLNIE